MEAQKPATKPIKAAKKKSNAPGIKNAAWVIVICAIIAVCLFIFWFGNPIHFDEDGHPQNLWGTVYKGGFIVPSSSQLSFSPLNAASPSAPPKAKETSHASLQVSKPLSNVTTSPLLVPSAPNRKVPLLPLSTALW